MQSWLNVPPDSRKAISAMPFALAHADRRGRMRLVVIMPHARIVDQNAELDRGGKVRGGSW